MTLKLYLKKVKKYKRKKKSKSRNMIYDFKLRSHKLSYDLSLSDIYLKFILI